ncbi:hypothetical protein [Desulfotruncus alcoholivorax]|uniref:hypothetical protein n=1 Tax=Desulfotruncus alcoholivorax TaxID=265477 RepID=UPI0012FE9525|nr:hypothetical protein [Desulfotruncus alcoholivorax]
MAKVNQQASSKGKPVKMAFLFFLVFTHLIKTCFSNIVEQEVALLLYDQNRKMVSLAQSDPYARNFLLIRNEGFVKKISANICSRFRQTSSDEVMEIAFSAFDEAIDIFPKTKERHFLSFARRVIELRLYEHFERAGKLSGLDIINAASTNVIPLIQKPEAEDRSQKILDLWEKHKHVLQEHGVCYEDLLRTNEKQDERWPWKVRNWLKNLVYKNDVG